MPNSRVAEAEPRSTLAQPVDHPEPNDVPRVTGMDRPWLNAALALIVLAVVLRLYLYWRAPSLWIDEAMLALNVGTRGFGQLFRPLDYAQSAPLLFLWAARVVTSIGGMGELGLRFIPMLLGLAFPPVLWLLARRILSERQALLALALAAVSPLLLRYGNEFKPYGPDASIAALLTLLGLMVAERPASLARWSWLALGGTVAAWASTPSAFVLAGIAVALAAKPEVRHAPRTRRAGIACAAVWALAFVPAYITFYAPASRNSFLRHYWEGSFLRAAPRVFARQMADIVGGYVSATFLQHDLFELTGQRLRYAYVLLLLAAAVVGLWQIYRWRGFTVAALLIAPTLIGFAASMIHAYPLSVRLMMYTVPPLLIVVAAGIGVAISRASRAPARHVVAGVLMFALFLPSMVHVLSKLRNPFDREHVRPIAARALQLVAPGEPIYVHATSAAQWVYYTTDWSAPDVERLKWYRDIGRVPGGPAFYDAPPRGHAVVAEGDNLERPFHGSAELVGVPSGMEVTSSVFVTHPDSAWATNEARRIRAAAPRCALLFLGHYDVLELSELTKAVTQTGARVMTVYEAAGGKLLRSCTDGPPAVETRPSTETFAVSSGP